MRALGWIGVIVAACVLAVAVGVAGWQFGWWLEAKNVDRQVQIDNRNKGTQTAWHDEALKLTNEVQLLPESAQAQRMALTRQACDLIGRLVASYRTDDLLNFQTENCR